MVASEVGMRTQQIFVPQVAENTQYNLGGQCEHS